MGQIVGKIEDPFLRRYLAQAPKNTSKVITSLYYNHFLPALRQTQEVEELVDIWSNTISRFGKPMSPRTVSKLVSIYREWHYRRHGYLPNTARIMRRVSRSSLRTVADHWSPAESVAALEAAAGEEEIYDRLLFTLHTGVRKEEMFALKKSDCLFVNDTVAIPSDPTYNVTKSALPRPIKMSAEVKAMLLRRTEGLPDDGLVFGTTEYLDRLRDVCRIAKIPFKRWHAMRHTFASTLLNSGVPLPVVSMLLGHGNPAITAAIYWHCVATDFDDTALPRRRSG